LELGAFARKISYFIVPVTGGQEDKKSLSVRNNGYSSILFLSEGTLHRDQRKMLGSLSQIRASTAVIDKRLLNLPEIRGLI